LALLNWSGRKKLERNLFSTNKAEDTKREQRSLAGQAINLKLLFTALFSADEWSLLSLAYTRLSEDNATCSTSNLSTTQGREKWNHYLLFALPLHIFLPLKRAAAGPEPNKVRWIWCQTPEHAARLYRPICFPRMRFYALAVRSALFWDPQLPRRLIALYTWTDAGEEAAPTAPAQSRGKSGVRSCSAAERGCKKQRIREGRGSQQHDVASYGSFWQLNFGQVKLVKIIHWAGQTGQNQDRWTKGEGGVVDFFRVRARNVPTRTRKIRDHICETD